MPTFSWTGFYLGRNGGYDFGSSSWTPVGGTGTCNFNPSGWLVGGQIGANWQISAFVLGAEADLDWASLKGSAGVTPCNTTPGIGGPTSTCQTAQSWLGTGRARLGVAADRVLFFLTVGVAYGNEKLTETPGTDTLTRVGWTGGGGVEAAFTPNWTAKVEYLYVSLGTGQCRLSATTCTATINVPLTENLIRWV